MEDVAAVVAADPPARDPLDDLVLRDLQVQDGVQLHALALEVRVQRLGLADVAREAVQQETALASGWSIRSSAIAIVTESGTRLPASM